MEAGARLDGCIGCQMLALVPILDAWAAKASALPYHACVVHGADERCLTGCCKNASDQLVSLDAQAFVIPTLAALFPLYFLQRYGQVCTEYEVRCTRTICVSGFGSLDWAS
ncbi:hypothetical protein V8C37DRAFT_396309 [Trichoderma ceciliae]